MTIIGINSSPHRGGHTATLLRAVLDGARQQGADTEEIFLPDYDIQFCRGCFACMSAGTCPLRDDFEELKQKLAAADGIVLGSPNYAFGPNAMMKRLIERFGMFEYMTSSVFGGKYMVTLATTGGQGADKVADYLASISRDGIFQRSYISGTVTAGQTGVHAVADDEDKLKKARQTGGNLARDIQEQNTYPLQNLIRRGMNALILRPKFRTIINRSKTNGMKAVYDNLVQRNLITAP